MEIQEIKKYMKAHRITYDELARRSGLSISTIKKIFSGISQYPRIDTIRTIERALGLDEETKKSLPTDLSEGESEWLQLYYALTEDNRELLLKMVSAFKDMPAERRRFVLDAIRLAANQQK